MCAPGCIEHVTAELSRRGLLTRAAGLAAGAAVAGGVVAGPAEAQVRRGYRRGGRRVVDLTHVLTPEFPTFAGTPGIAMRATAAFAKDGYNMNEWVLQEHSGTHIDAPIHFSKEGPGPAELPAEQLVVPIVVIDVTAKAEKDADYQLSADDVRAWEKRHGRLPRGACVAMRSGWDRHVATAGFAGKDAAGVMHFPGIHPDAAAMLLAERQVRGLAVDTLSLDHGPSKDFKTHYAWLPAGRWGLECVANLASLPARGATLMVGAPRIKGASGGPVRLLAMF